MIRIAEPASQNPSFVLNLWLEKEFNRLIRYGVMGLVDTIFIITSAANRATSPIFDNLFCFKTIGAKIFCTGYFSFPPTICPYGTCIAPSEQLVVAGVNSRSECSLGV